jgi:hypothetical protein
MRMAGAREILGRAAELDQDRALVDHLAGLHADDVRAQHAIGLRIGQELYEAIGLLVGFRTAVRGEREFADVVGDARGLQLLLGLADGGNLRRGVDHARNGVVVHVPGLARDNFRNRNALILGLVRQHRAAHDVADGVDALHIGRKMVVDLDPTAIVDRDACFLQAETFGVGDAADADQHDVRFQRLCRAASRRFDADLQRFTGRIDTRDLRAELECHALLFQHALELPRDLAVHTRQNAIEEFHHGDLRAEPAPDRTELETDDAGAHHQQLARHLVQGQRAGGRHHALLVDLDALEFCDVGAGGDDDVLRLQRFRLAVGGLHFDLAGTEHFARPLIGIDLVLLEQEGHTLGVAVDRLVLEIQQRRQVEIGLADLDAHFRKRVRDLLEPLRSEQQRFRRNAADVEASAAEGRPLLHHRNLHAELSCTNGADVAAGTGADDDEIIGSHGRILSLNFAGSAPARNIQNRAGDVGGLVGNQPDDRVGNLVRRADPLHRHRSDEALQPIGVAAAGVNFGIDQPGPDGRDANAFRRHLAAETDRKRVDRSF